MSNIILIGMPGAGKSTLGVVLAKTLNKEFIDTDLLIQKEHDDLLHKIINKIGLESFIELEEQSILKMHVKNAIIATGGSVVYSQKAMEYLKSSGIVVYLKVPVDELTERLNNIKTRGVVMKKGQSIESLYQERVLLYEKYADIIIDCNLNTLEQNIDLLVEAIEK